MRVTLSDWGKSLGTRDLGEKVRMHLLNELEFSKTPIEVSFCDVFMISSSFADECFGKLILGIGKEQFKRCFQIIDLNDKDLKLVLNRSVKQRLAEVN
ncbi:STAS-like domain-containing protein [Paenibacillus kribbensis]|uniref:STAS-like domain-containing protein n=1 Tax=Paenibacillus kribbensis TaxID=172713 RepID=UPI002DBE8D1D|nr:STAS-like domain-containing protein [Paenibacillus kribbensis]MEC0233751.1 STAS-like domain-containing protein [Paenibacillus kribbensis]